MTAADTHWAIEATFRVERARLIAGLARIVRDVDLAEDLAQDALVVALSEWPKVGVPVNLGAWLTVRRGSPRCWRSSTSFSTQAMPPPRATTLSDRACT